MSYGPGSGKMTLERHRSSLIPDIQYSLDGTLFVTDTGGTFPVRGKAAKRNDVRAHSFLDDVEPAPSFRSYDAHREEKKRRFKQRNRNSDVASGTSTVGTNNSSLGRRLRRSIKKKGAGEGQFTYQNRTSSMYNTGSRLRSGPPQMTKDFADTIRQKNANRSKSMDEIIKGTPLKGSMPFIKRDSKRNSVSSGYVDPKARYHKIHDEKLPYIVFIVDSVLLLLIGIARIVTSYWHEYYAPLWMAVLTLMLGIVGAKHKGQHLLKSMSGAYIFLAFLTGFGALVASGIVLQVFMPMIMIISDSQSPMNVISQVSFTNMAKTVSTVRLSPGTMVWISVGLDIGTLIALFIAFFAMTAAMVAISNHWDACYDTTDECDHRGNPRVFNPIEQVGLGVATGFIGLVYISAEAGYSHISYNHYYSPAWASAMVIVAGIVSFCFGKRPDQRAMGTFACFVEVWAFLASIGAAVLTTLGVVDYVNQIQDLPDSSKVDLKYKELVAMSVIGGALDLLLTINVIFIAGTVFRQFRQVCCRDCCRGEEHHAPDGYYSSMERGSKYNSLDRNKNRR